MNDKNTTPDQVENLLNSLSAIEKVEVSPDFKKNVIDKLANQQSKVVEFLPWFTPKYQIAAVLTFLVINLSALFYYNTTLQEEKLESLANSYGITTTENESSL
ncbi:hypothetical protein HCU67_00355 [Muricauda sp. DJ-13]|uniref:Uncharacterized protein n=2 Tax=Croceivirga thetidis TaxID=2721623 RepID=A0ABX1GKD8_9FLAO|nr:hypothetical protein [Croceivirga thetidis]